MVVRRGNGILFLEASGAKGPSIILRRDSGIGGALSVSGLTNYMQEAAIPGAQTWSAIMDMGISALQLEHLIVGKKLEARVMDVMFAFHLFFKGSRGQGTFVWKHAALRVRAACLG